MTDNQHRLIAMGHLAKELNSEQCQLSGILKINIINDEDLHLFQNTCKYTYSFLIIK